MKMHYGVVVIMAVIIAVIGYLKLNRFRKTIAVISVSGLLVFFSFVVYIMSGHSYIASGESYDYIMIFGGGIEDDLTLPSTVVNRLDKAMEADVENDAIYVVSGGIANNIHAAEAAYMSEYLMSLGVDQDRIIEEGASTSTWENLNFVHDIIGPKLGDRVKVLGVSSEFHLKRIHMLTERLGFEMDLLASKTPLVKMLNSVPREFFATVKSYLVDRVDMSVKVAVSDNSDTAIGLDKERVYAYDQPKSNQVIDIDIAAVGDIMVHRSQLIRAYDEDGFDFSPTFEYIRPWIESADLAIGNLETTLAGVNGQRKINVEKFYNGYSGYPVFNSPDILADNLKEAGFDVLLTANNHSLDSSEDGVDRTLAVLDHYGLEHVGTYGSNEASLVPYVVAVEGITFGIVNYTYGMNGFVLDEASSYLVNNLGNYQDEAILKMYEDVEAMERSGVDFVVAAIHYGIEYRDEPDTTYQQALVNGLFDHGADIVLGGHPHVLQPFEVRSITRQDGEVETGVVIYSLGNFISSQRHRYTHKDTDYGLVFNMHIKKVNDEKPRIDSLSLTPTYVYWSNEDLQIVPFLALPEDIVFNSEDQQRLERGEKMIVPHLLKYWDGQWEINNGSIVVDIKNQEK